MATRAFTASASQPKTKIIKSVVGETTLPTEYHAAYALRKVKVVFTLARTESTCTHG